MSKNRPPIKSPLQYNLVALPPGGPAPTKSTQLDLQSPNLAATPQIAGGKLEDEVVELADSAADILANNSRPNGDDVDARMAKIEEILDNAAMHVLEKSALVAERMRHAEANAVSVFGQPDHKPQGGRPEGGIARAARALAVPGKTTEARRKFVERAIDIDGIWPEVKVAARTAGLDDIQSALLAIADEKSLEAQLAKAEEIAARKKAPRRKSSAREDGESALSLAEVEHLKTELVAATERQRELEEELETARGMASLAPAVDASTNASRDLEIPPALDRRPLGSEDQLKFDVAMTAWESSTELRAALVSASPVVLERFIAAFREEIASARSPVM
jgi:hypothetical protein